MRVPPAHVLDFKERVRVLTTAHLPLRLNDGTETSGTIYSFYGLSDGREHFAVRLGEPEREAPLVRVHSECITGDALGSARCDCGSQLQESLTRLHTMGGYLLYLRQEGRGIGLYQKLEAYRLQEQGHDTFSANRILGHSEDERNYSVAADMLRALDLVKISLLSNNPDKRSQLEKLGIQVVANHATGVFAGRYNLRYLKAKVRHTGHTIDLGSTR